MTPLCIPLLTGADIAPPTLTAEAANISATSFDVLVSMDERGGVWHLAVEPLMQALGPLSAPESTQEPTVSRRMSAGNNRRRLLQLATTTATPDAPVPTPTATVDGVSEVDDPTDAPTATPTGGSGTQTPAVTATDGELDLNPTATPETLTTTPGSTPTGQPSTPIPASTPTPTPTEAASPPPPSPSPPPQPPLPSPPLPLPPPLLAAPPPPPPPTPSAVLCVRYAAVELSLSTEQVLNGSLPAAAGASLVPGAHGRTAVPIVGSLVRVAIAGLRPDTLYRVYLLGEDLAGNRMEAPVSLAVSTLDTIPPTFVYDSPALGGTSSRNFTLLAAMDEPGRVAYVVLRRGDPTPTSEQVLAGEGGSAQESVSAGSFPVPQKCLEGEGVVVDGIEPDTAYDVWLVGLDIAENYMPIPSRLSLVTVDDLPPTLINVTNAPRCYGVQSNVTLDEGGTLAYLLSECVEGLRSQVGAGSVFEGQLPGGLTPLYNGSLPVGEELPVALNFGGLADASRYLLFLAAEDLEPTPNRMLAPYRGGVVVSTDDCDPPQISASVNLADSEPEPTTPDQPRLLSATLTVQLDEAAVLGIQVLASRRQFTPHVSPPTHVRMCSVHGSEAATTNSRRHPAELLQGFVAQTYIL